MNKKETTVEFIARIKSLPKLDITDKKTMVEFGNRIAEATDPEIRELEILQKKSLGRAFTMVVR